MNKYLVEKIILGLIVVTTFFSCKQVDERSNTEDKKANYNEIDSSQVEVNNVTDKGSFNFLPTSTTNQIVVHDKYTLSYSEKYEQAEWVAYELKPSKSGYHDYERPFFIEDPLVKTGSADWKNYKRSGYDKGHLCPAGDMKTSQKAYEDTFFTSNISPQDHNFNDGIWNTLEGKVRYWSTKYHGIYVVTGGILREGLETIGKEDVAVPEYFYKVLLRNTNGDIKMIGFLLPAKDSNQPLYKFVVPVDKIEQMTGIDFFPNLDDKIETELERSNDYKNWSF